MLGMLLHELLCEARCSCNGPMARLMCTARMHGFEHTEVVDEPWVHMHLPTIDGTRI